MNRRTEILMVYMIPVVFGVMRLVITLILLFSSGKDFPLRYIQIIPLLVVAASCFRLYRLYIDATPIITLLAPTIVQTILCAMFFGSIPVLHIVIIFAVDALFIVAKLCKQMYIPFQIDGIQTEDFSDIIDD